MAVIDIPEPHRRKNRRGVGGRVESARDRRRFDVRRIRGEQTRGRMHEQPAPPVVRGHRFGAVEHGEGTLERFLEG